MRRGQLGAALMEFALAWPIVLTLVLGAVQLTVWASETMTARAASLAGARAGSVAGGTPEQATEVALRILRIGLVGVHPEAWCPGASLSTPEVWVCSRAEAAEVSVEVGGTVPSLVPAIFGAGLPLHAEVALQKELFTP